MAENGDQLHKLRERRAVRRGQRDRQTAAVHPELGVFIFRPGGASRYLLQLHTRSSASEAAEHPALIDTQAGPSERMAFDSQNVVKKEKREENFQIHIGASPLQLWNK